MVRPQGDPLAFVMGQRVRYRPGTGTYGYEHLIEADGRIPAQVIGHTPQRVRIMVLSTGTLRRRRFAVDAASLVKV